jgi:hypothetical protein
VHASLGGGVGRRAWPWAKRDVGPDVHDHAAAGRRHPSRGFAGDQERALQVLVQRSLPDLVLEL